MQSRTYLTFYQYLGKPMSPVLLVAVILLLVALPPMVVLAVALGGTMLLSLVLNSPLGLVVEEATADWLAEPGGLFAMTSCRVVSLDHLGVDLVPRTRR